VVSKLPRWRSVAAYGNPYTAVRQNAYRDISRVQEEWFSKYEHVRHALGLVDEEATPSGREEVRARCFRLRLHTAAMCTKPNRVSWEMS
jgi:hypothetical protein